MNIVYILNVSEKNKKYDFLLTYNLLYNIQQ